MRPMACADTRSARAAPSGPTGRAPGAADRTVHPRPPRRPGRRSHTAVAAAGGDRDRHRSVGRRGPRRDTRVRLVRGRQRQPDGRGRNAGRPRGSQPGAAAPRRLSGLCRRRPRVRRAGRPEPGRLDRRGRTRPVTGPRSTSAPCRNAVRTSAAARTRASRTTGSIVRAISRATTGSGSRQPGSCSDRRHGAWIATRPRSMPAAC